MEENQNDKAVAGILDFDAMVPAPRQFRVAGRVIDVTRLPAQISLDFARFADGVQGGDLSNEDTLTRVFQLVSTACVLTDPEVTVPWLLEHTTFEQLMGIVDYVLEPLRKRGNARAPKKAKP
jgi:hypothetical protein